MKDKTQSYAKYVKEIHWPEVSNKKQEELEHIKASLKHPVRQPRSLYESKTIDHDKPLLKRDESYEFRSPQQKASINSKRNQS